MNLFLSLYLSLQSNTDHFKPKIRSLSPYFKLMIRLMEWNPYPPHLKCVECLYPHSYKMWNAYISTFTKCGILTTKYILQNHLNIIFIPILTYYGSIQSLTISMEYNNKMIFCIVWPVYNCTIIHTWTLKLDLIHHQQFIIFFFLYF